MGSMCEVRTSLLWWLSSTGIGDRPQRRRRASSMPKEIVGGSCSWAYRLIAAKPLETIKIGRSRHISVVSIRLGRDGAGRAPWCGAGESDAGA